MPETDDLDLLLASFRSDSRPAALVAAADDGGCRIIAASRAMLAALSLSDDDGVACLVERLGGAATLARHAGERSVIDHETPENGTLVLSVREQRSGVYELRGSLVDSQAHSNSLIAGVISTIDNNETGIMFLDPDWRLLAVNKAFYRFFPKRDDYPKLGEPFSNLIEDTIHHGYLPEAVGQEERFVGSTLKHFARADAEPLIVRTGNGRIMNTSRLRFRNGALAILLIDATESRKQIEQYRSFVQSTRQMIYVRLIGDGSRARIWGRDASEMVGVVGADGTVDVSRWRDVIHPEDLGRYEAAERKRRKENIPYRIEYRFRHPQTGQQRWMLENAWVATDPVTGERALDSYLIDITGRKQAEEELRRSQQRLQAFSDMAGDWYFEADEEMRITYLSEGFEKVSGIEADRFVGHSWEKITHSAMKSLPEELHGAWLELLESWRAGRPVKDHELHFPFGNGPPVPISSTCGPIFDDDGRLVGYRGVSKNVSDIVAAKEQALKDRASAEAANRAKSQFIANMSHELRTPLNAIIGFASIMEQDMFGPIGNPRYRAYASDISASGQHLLSLVNDILDLSRIEADRQSCDPEWLDATDELGRARALFREETEGRVILVDVDPKGGRVWADRRALRQVLINLLGNAVKFTARDGEIRLSCRTRADGATITVADNGAGMSESEIELALEPFGRAASSEIAGGTGLGLPISRQLMELHGGELEIEARPGAGVAVTVRFPAPDKAALARSA